MTAALAVAALASAAGPALAQRGGHSGFHGNSFPGNSFHGSSFNGTNFHGGFHSDFRGGFHEGFRFGYFPGFSGFWPGYGRGFYGSGLGYARGFYGSGYGPSYAAYAYPSSSYGPDYGPSYGSPGSGYGSDASGYSGTVVSGYYTPSADAAPEGGATGPADNCAYIRMEVPADAEVWVEGVKTSQVGPVREFVSPALDVGRAYVYTIRARWTVDGRPVEQTREVSARANAWTDVDFTKPSQGPERLPAPATQ
jgi:uncharacterized protein (TIGR03000 family)